MSAAAFRKIETGLFEALEMIRDEEQFDRLFDEVVGSGKRPIAAANRFAAPDDHASDKPATRIAGVLTHGGENV